MLKSTLELCAIHIKFLLLSIVIISLAQGCSFSIGSKSSADSSTNYSDSSNSFTSSPASSSSDDEEKYQLEVMNYTSVYISSSVFDLFAFSRGISELASENGITNWEDDEATLTGIGRGLKHSNISGNVFELYKRSIAGSYTKRVQLIQKGYDMQ